MDFGDKGIGSSVGSVIASPTLVLQYSLIVLLLSSLWLLEGFDKEILLVHILFCWLWRFSLVWFIQLVAVGSYS